MLTEGHLPTPDTLEAARGDVLGGGVAPSGVAPSATLAARRAVRAQAWIPDLVMVDARGVTGLKARVEAAGGRVVRPPGRAGYALVEIEGGPARLAEDPETSMLMLAPVGRLVASTNGSGSADESPARRWHMDHIGIPPVDFSSDVLIGVIDSGMASRRYQEGGNVEVPDSLQGVHIEASLDLVDGDASALDDNGHGTHVSSVLLGDDSELPGVAPAARAMPIRVLDGNNEGNELDLVEAIHHALDNGAQVINLSLEFPEGYVPSQALLDVLDRARSSDVVLIAAAGNELRSQVAWPAASPNVIAVGASILAPEETLEIAPYTNVGMGLDIFAPGGVLDRDVDGDGHPDGILGEMIYEGEPTRAWMAGTSQAAAIVSGAAARLLDAGVVSGDIRAVLQRGARGAAWSSSGYSVGHMDIYASYLWAMDHTVRHRTYELAMVPFLRAEEGTGRVRPAVMLSLTQGGEPVDGQVRVGLELHGTSTLRMSCMPAGEQGTCIADTETWFDSDVLIGWLVSAEVVVEASGESFRPEPVVYLPEELDLVFAEAAAQGESRSGLAWSWSEGLHEELGLLAGATSFLVSGSSHAETPSALLLSDGAVAALGASEQSIYSYGEDGGTFEVLDVAFDSVMSMGGSSTSSLAITEGAGLATSPILSANDLVKPKRWKNGQLRAKKKLRTSDLTTAGGTLDVETAAWVDGQAASASGTTTWYAVELDVSWVE